MSPVKGLASLPKFAEVGERKKPAPKTPKENGGLMKASAAIVSLLSCATLVACAGSSGAGPVAKPGQNIATAPAKGSVNGTNWQLANATYRISKSRDGSESYSLTFRTEGSVSPADPCVFQGPPDTAQIFAIAPAARGTYAFPDASLTFSYVKDGTYHNDIPGDAVVVILSEIGDQLNGQIKGSFGTSAVEGSFSAQRCPEDRVGRSNPAPPQGE